MHLRDRACGYGDGLDIREGRETDLALENRTDAVVGQTRRVVPAPGERAHPRCGEHAVGARDELPELDVRGPTAPDETLRRS